MNSFTYLFSYILTCTLLPTGLWSQDAFDIVPQKYNLGKIENYHNDTLWFTIKNTSNKPWFFLRHFKDRDIQLINSYDKIAPGSNTRVGLLYYTEKTGNFKKEVPLYINTESDPISLKVEGNIVSIHPMALTICPSINPAVPSRTNNKTDTMRQRNNVPDKGLSGVLEPINIFRNPRVAEEELQFDTKEFPDDKRNAFASKDLPNHIVLILDRSRSMSYDGKLVMMQNALKSLINAMRSQKDKLTILSYSRGIRVECEFFNADSLNRLEYIIDNIKADGGSYGAKAVVKAYDLAEKHYLAEGNNLIILATDGKFNDKGFEPKTLYRLAKNKTRDKNIRITGLALGDDHDALMFLVELSQAGEGRYVHVSDSDDSTYVLLDLIKEISRRSR